MATTPIYGFPYQALTDSPDGAGLGQNLALAVETKIAAVDAADATAAANYVNSAHGIVGGTRYTGTGALVFAASPEAAAGMATPSLALKANRLYVVKVRYKITYSSGSVTSTIVRIRDTNLTGAILAEDVRDAANIASGHTWNFEFDYETSGAVSKIFFMTLLSNGAGSTINGGGTTNPTYVEVYDMGPAGLVTVQNTP